MQPRDTLPQNLLSKLKILTDAAKYDASCSSSGSSRAARQGSLGEAASCGICHSWAEDGRCISLLKILLTNKCMYDCAYCLNRRSHDTPRTEFSPQEIAELTLNFYRRNYIEGLFLSSGVLRSPDYTMEQLIRTAELLRGEGRFRGYLHMKAIPGASPELVRRLGYLVDRLSVNIELPSSESLALLAPEKSYAVIEKPMAEISGTLIANQEERKHSRRAPLFAPAGQSTQMIVGASRENDRDILLRAEGLYQDYQLKRVFYSGFVPVVSSPLTAGISKPPLLREHRLYQADWLLRYYDFTAAEILPESSPRFDLLLDPKLNWALLHPELFPVAVNRASLEELLRVPGLGPRNARKILRARRIHPLRWDDLAQLRISTVRARYFITLDGQPPLRREFAPPQLRALFQARELAAHGLVDTEALFIKRKMAQKGALLAAPRAADSDADLYEEALLAPAAGFQEPSHPSDLSLLEQALHELVQSSSAFYRGPRSRRPLEGQMSFDEFL